MSMTLTDVARMRQECLVDPFDDVCRLILADALEDAGEVAEAEFIRASMELATCELPGCATDPPGGMINCFRCEWCFRWSAVVMAGRRVWSGESLPPKSPNHAMHRRDAKPFPETVWGYWRGLPEVWAVADVPTFERDAKEVFSRHPIQQVVLRCEVGVSIVGRVNRLETSIQRGIDKDRVGWRLMSNIRSGMMEEQFIDRPGGLKIPLYKFFAFRDLAREELEAACVRYGRILANLPPLEEA